MNGFHDSFDPRSAEDPSQLYYPAGSRFVIDFLNEVERRWPFVDQIKPVTTLIWYALQWDFDFASKALACFVRQTPVLAAGYAEPEHELSSPADRLLYELEDIYKRRELSRQYRGDPGFRRQFHHQIRQYLDEAALADLPSSNISDDPREMGQLYQKQQRARLRRAAEKIAEQEKARVILFGHTHEPVQEVLSNGSLYVNTGSWIKDFSNVSAETWEMLFKGLQPQRNLPHPLPYARIDYDEANNPRARLLYFNNTRTTAMPAAKEPLTQFKLADQGFFEKNFQWLFRFLKTSS
jgi:hypothetical protein